MSKNILADEPYTIIQLTESINLFPKQINKNFENNILQNLRSMVEGKCLKDGYIRPCSVVIIKRSNGYYKGNHLEGEMTFDVEFMADVCRPVKGDIVVADVYNINKLGLVAKKGPLLIYAIKQHCDNNTYFEKGISIGQTLKFEVNTSKFQPGKDTITVIAKIKDLLDDNKFVENTNRTVNINMDTGIDDLIIQKSTNIPQPQIRLGYDKSIMEVRSKYKKSQDDYKKYCQEKLNLNLIKKSNKFSDEEQITRIVQNKIRMARASSNKLEMVCPSVSYGRYLYSDNNKPIDRATFKMWEMIVDFNLLPTKEEEPVIVTAHLAEDPGGFVEATLKWRQRTQDDPLENNVSDKPFGISLREETISAPGIPLDKMETNFRKDYPNFKSIYGGEEGEPNPDGYDNRQGDGTGNLFYLGNILDFAANVNSEGGAHLVTSDLGFDFDEVEDIREQVMYFPIFAQMVGCLSCQKYGGNLVIKIFDIYTDVTVKLISYMSKFYEDFYITKPYTSRPGNSEKYIIGVGFLGIEKSELENLYETFEEWKNTEKYIGAEYRKNTKYISDIKNINLKTKTINDVFEFNMNNSRQTQLRTIIKMEKYIRNEPSIEEQKRIKQEQEKDAFKWFNKYKYPL